MVVNQKDKKEIKSNPNKKQTQSKESRALRLIKERKRKAQLRTNPALCKYNSIYNNIYNYKGKILIFFFLFNL